MRKVLLGTHPDLNEMVEMGEKIGKCNLHIAGNCVAFSSVHSFFLLKWEILANARERFMVQKYKSVRHLMGSHQFS